MSRAATSGRGLAALAGVVALLVFSFSALGAPRPKQPIRTFKLSGSVRGLYPGGLGHVAVTVRNPYRKTLRVRALRVLVRDALPGCPASSLRIRPFQGYVDVRPRRSRRVWVAVRMVPSAGDACRGARFPLSFRATGVVWP
jgi:hypothetical protein